MVNFAEVGNDLYTGKRSIDFIGRQKVWYAVSGVLIALALVGFFARGLNFGIEFRGGSEFRVSGVSSTANYEQRAQSAMSGAGVTGNVVATVIGSNTVRVQTESAGEQNDAAKTALASTFSVPAENISASLIGPSWGASVSQKAIQGLVIFLVLVAIFMAIYFRTWTMAVAGLVALLHDLVITVGIYALFGFEITPSSMIGFLTILGYSLYDTVVVFDKVRENTSAALSSKRMTYRDAANLAVNQTLVRSINTTVVALLPIAAILVVGFTLLGPGTLLDLSLALFVGIAVGAYSSIFIATPLLVDLRSKERDIVELDKAVARTSGRAASTRTPVAAGVGARAQAAEGDRASVAHTPSDATLTGDDATSPVVRESPSGSPREVHKWAQAGPRNQPKRPPKSKR